MYLASNSPRPHVLRVLTALGLRNAGFAGILTPDADEALVDVGVGGEGERRWGDRPPFPTKSSPEAYYRPVLRRYPPGDGHRLVLLDDSSLNLERAASVGIGGLLVDPAGNVDGATTLEGAIAIALGHADPAYRLSDAEYLRAKNAVDAESIDPAVWSRLADELSARLSRSGGDDEGLKEKEGEEEYGVLRISDVGAGLLSMLDMMLQGGGESRACWR